MNIDLVNYAIRFVGVREIPGKQHNSIIAGWTNRVLSWAFDDEVAWCSNFMNAMAEDCGYERSKQANARSWLNVGEEVFKPELGDVAVFWRTSPDSWKGHVGIFMGYTHDQKHIVLLGGNQGDAVSIALYPTHQLLSFRRLRKV